MEGKMPNAGNKLVIKMAPWTNGDAIRDMTDEELAEFMANKIDCQYCSVRTAWCTESEASCKTNWLDWLSQEVDDVKDQPTP